MKSFITVCALALLGSCLSAPAADMMVARWTFNDGWLKSDVGDFILQQVDEEPEPTLTLADGCAKLSPRALLVCEQINNKNMPGLANAITIWARLRIDAPVDADAFVLGLRDQSHVGDWRNMVLTMLARPEPPKSTGIFARINSGATVTSGSRHISIEPGRFVSLALVFDGYERSVTYVVDGQAVASKHQDAVSLGDFSNFAVGRLKMAGMVGVTLDELRVYSVALTPEWVAEIVPVK